MQSPELWKIDKEKTDEHWLEVVDPDGWWSAFVKWDGCLEITRYYNNPLHEQDGEDSDRLHLCSIHDGITRLIALRQLALQHFGQNWEGDRSGI